MPSNQWAQHASAWLLIVRHPVCKMSASTSIVPPLAVSTHHAELPKASWAVSGLCLGCVWWTNTPVTLPLCRPQVQGYKEKKACSQTLNTLLILLYPTCLMGCQLLKCVAPCNHAITSHNEWFGLFLVMNGIMHSGNHQPHQTFCFAVKGTQWHQVT